MFLSKARKLGEVGHLKKTRVLCLVRLPITDAASRHRVYQYKSILSSKYGICLDIVSIYPESVFQYRQRAKGAVSDAIALFVALERTVQTIVAGTFYDAILMLRDPAPFSITWGLKYLKRLGKPIIYDFDDALHLKNSRVITYWNMADVVLAGNTYLASAAKKYCEDVRIIPTTVDLREYRPKDDYSLKDNRLRVGWLGSPSTAPYLGLIAGALDTLGRELPVEFLSVGGLPPNLSNCKVEYTPWSLGIEARVAPSFDVAVAPLPDDEWTRGKCGFKIIEYMAAGVPVVASPVGVQSEIIRSGENGLLANTPEEWVMNLRRLATDPILRERLGRAGRATVVAAYDLENGAQKLADAILSVVGQRRL